MKKIWPVSNGSGNKGSFLKNAGGKESWPLDLSPTVRSPVQSIPPPPPPPPPEPASRCLPILTATTTTSSSRSTARRRCRLPPTSEPPPLRLSARHPCPLFLAAMLAESGVGQRSASLLGGGDCKRSAGDEVVRRSCSPYSSCCLCLWVEVVVT